MSLCCPRIVPQLRGSTDSQNMLLHTALGGYLQQILLGQMLLAKFRLRRYEGIGLYPWGYHIFCVKLEKFLPRKILYVSSLNVKVSIPENEISQSPIQHYSFLHKKKQYVMQTVLILQENLLPCLHKSI